MDFDSLAAQFGVAKLRPSARMILGYPLTGNVRDFVALYRSSLPIAQMKYVDRERVTRLFIVDCQHIERLDENARVLIDGREKRLPYTIFDHHDLDPDGLGPRAERDSAIDRVGAATTLVVERLQSAGTPLSSFDATLLLIGIYEDTGCLTYAGTCERDANCVAYLLRCGADLGIVNDYIHAKLNDVQTELMQDLVKSARVFEINGTRVAIATGSRTEYIDGLASLTRRLTEIESVAAAFTVVFMRDRVHIVARNDSRAVDARSIIRALGGDGHPGAASAVVRNRNVEQVVQQIQDMLKDAVRDEPAAKDIMTSPVRTILPAVSMDEASRIMIRYGLDGLLVAENDEVIGVVSRRDIDQAQHHKLGHAPVQGFMSRPVICVEPSTPLSEVQRLIISEDIGRLPVVDRSAGNRLVGLVSRHDVLKMLYGHANSTAAFFGQQPISFSLQRTVTNVSGKMEELSEPTVWLARHVGKAAAELDMVAYAVGGFVRDLLLGRPNFDLDFVVEGGAWALADCLQSRFPQSLQVIARHERFHTATMEYKRDGERTVDFSTARTEVYEYPAALPTVEPSRLDQDLIRRDFTINAMAICVNPDRFGELIDEFGGLTDLRDKVVRTLHRFSFIEDPTRIMRAVRFAARLGFILEHETAEQAKHAIAIGIFDDLGGTRIRDELRLILESSQRLRALELLSQLGARLRYLDSELEYSQRIRKAIRRAERLLGRYQLSGIREQWIVYLGLLLSQLAASRLEAVLERLHLTNDQKTIIQKGFSIAQELPQLAQQSHKPHGLKNSEIYHLLRGNSDASLAIAACLADPGSSLRRVIKIYLEKLEAVRLEITGDDLLKLGFSQGPEIGRTLEAILDARLNGSIASRDDELALARSLVNRATSA